MCLHMFSRQSDEGSNQLLIFRACLCNAVEVEIRVFTSTETLFEGGSDLHFWPPVENIPKEAFGNEICTDFVLQIHADFGIW